MSEDIENLANENSSSVTFMQALKLPGVLLFSMSFLLLKFT
jgi:hypothetical protein